MNALAVNSESRVPRAARPVRGAETAEVMLPRPVRNKRTLPSSIIPHACSFATAEPTKKSPRKCGYMLFEHLIGDAPSAWSNTRYTSGGRFAGKSPAVRVARIRSGRLSRPRICVLCVFITPTVITCTLILHCRAYSASCPSLSEFDIPSMFGFAHHVQSRTKFGHGLSGLAHRGR